MRETDPPDRTAGEGDGDGATETDEEREARRTRRRFETIENITPEQWDEAREEYEESERQKTKKIFGDKPPTLYVDRYDDL
jgi:hypothetical protein